MASETRLRVRYAETDKMGGVHHAVYPIWFEAARGDYIRKQGVGYDEIEKMGFMIPLHDLTCTYIKPCVYEEEVIIRTRVVKANAVKVVFSYEIYVEGEDAPRAKGTTTHAWVRTGDFKMVNLKREAPEIYEMLIKCVKEDIPDEI